jgi:predicted RNase H-like HicB family nuclease
MPLTIEIDREVDGRWIAEVPELPGVLVYGETKSEAIDNAQILSRQVIKDRLDHGEPAPSIDNEFAIVI